VIKIDQLKLLGGTPSVKYNHMRKVFLRISICLFLFVSADLMGQVNIPETSGFRGFVRPSTGFLNFSNNMVASFLRYDLAETEIPSVYSKPESQNMFVFLLPFEVSYTFAKTKTQIVFGTKLDDFIRFNLTQQVGVKQQFEKVGILQAGFLLNSLPTMVWADPYMADSSRTQTDRHSYGIRVMWDLIFNSGFRFQYSLRRIKLGNESSGVFIGLDPGEQLLLERKGYTHSFELLYWFKLKKRQLLAPSFLYVYDDRSGAARARNAYEFRLNYIWLGKQFGITANSFIGYTKFKGPNPIYYKTQEDIYFNIVATAYYKNPWGWKIGNSEPMNFFLNVAIYRSNTNIDFYYRDAFLVTAGVFFRWAKNK